MAQKVGILYTVGALVSNRNVLTNFHPCSHSINPNNETCLVTCATYVHGLCMHSFSFDLPLNQDTSTYVQNIGTDLHHAYVRTYIGIHHVVLHVDRL